MTAERPAGAGGEMEARQGLRTQCSETIEQLPPIPRSVQTVLCTLVGHDPMTGREIRDATHLPRRTIYAALQRLKELGVLHERPSLRDTRQTFYWVTAPVKPDERTGIPASAVANAAA